MRERSWRTAALAATAAAMVVAGCGGGNEGSANGGGGSSSSSPRSAKRGGDLTMLYNGDVDNIDPRITYYQYGMNVAYTTQRPLYSYKPGDATTPVPDLAEGPPDVSKDGKTVTVKIRQGVKYSPPVNRAVTSADVRYAIESSFTPNVPGPYFGAYLADLKGLAAFKAHKAKHISGLKTPDDHTIVFELSRPRGAIVAGALSMPASAPVPEEYAKQYDAHNPSTYGDHQVSTGPYMIKKYTPGNVIELVRNPNWDGSTDYKPAYLDSITIREGSQPDVASRQIETGSRMVSGDFQLPAQTLQQVTRSSEHRQQLVLTPPTGRFRYISLNTRDKPFDNVNVRKAIIAGFDRTALRQAYGGPLTGVIPTHFIPPGQPGFAAAGGMKGPGYDFMAHPSGDMALAASYMQKAGYPSGKYTGGQTFSAVADNAGPARNVAEVSVAQFAKLGFKVKMNFVTHDAMYTKFCQVPKSEPAICPSVGWLKDFADPETLLSLPFNGKNILQVGNSNFALLDDAGLNAMMDKAEVVNQPAARATAWGKVDDAVTAQAPGILWLWDKQPVLESADVNGVINKAQATWDLGFTSVH
jgi:peptide/nickel transport system substrate-binding protein